MMWLAACFLGLPGAAVAEEAPGPQVTIYNQDFALIKERRTLDLRQGENEVRMTDVTSLMEPDSIILRDRRNPDAIRILEQNYVGETLSESYLLSQYEGKTLTFQSINPATGEIVLRTGRIIRSGHVPRQTGWRLGGGRSSFPADPGDRVTFTQ